MKTSELIGPALDWAVAKCEGLTITWDDVFQDFWLETDVHHGLLGNFKPSTDWSQGGPIIEREKMLISPEQERDGTDSWDAVPCTVDDGPIMNGPTPLIAAMRCYVANKLGDEVDVPKELK